MDQDFFSLLRTNPGLPLQQEDEEEEQGIPTLASIFGGIEGRQSGKRNFLDRVFAPFEAPQQFLFSLTTEIDDDGFQIGDVSKSLSHALRYGNPMSDVERIDPEEVRRVFFGDREVSDFWRGTTNVALSLLYDPLLINPVTRAAGVVSEGSRAWRAIDAVTNPAGAAIGASVRGAGRALRPVREAAEGTELGAKFLQTWVQRYAGVPELAQRAEMKMQQGVQAWRNEAYQIIKKAEDLGGRDAHRIMGEALENEAIWLTRTGRGNTKAKKEFDKLERRLEDMGVDKDLFWDIYDRSRTLDDEIGMGLVKSGVIAGEKFQELQGKHLRRMFLATEKPLEYAERIERLNIPAQELFSINKFRKGLNEIRADLDKSILQVPRGQDPLFNMSEVVGGQGSRYFRDGDRTRFNVNAFVADLDDYLAKNSNASADDIFRHIQDDMLAGAELPDQFWKRIGNHISGSYEKTLSGPEMAEQLRRWHYEPGITWHTVSERLEVVTDRKPLSDELRAALGEYLDFAPRIAAEATDAGRLLETRRYIDEVAGVVRDADDPTRILRKGGNKVAYTAEQAAESGRKDLVRLQGNHFGELDGMYVSRGMALHLGRLQGIGAPAGDPSRKIATKLTDIIRRATGVFKMHKVVLSPAGQVRNFLGGLIAADLVGVTPFSWNRLGKAAMELRDLGKSGSPGKYLRLADEAGVTMFQNTFSRQELQMFADKLGRELTGDPNKTRSALERVFGGIKDGYENYSDAMGNLFEFQEKMIKLMIFMERYDNIINPMIRRGKQITPEVQKSAARQAGELAERAMFNYADIPYAAQFMRDYGVVPFITYPMKAAPFFARTLVEHPHRVLKYNRLVESHNAMMAGSHEDAAREIAALPEYMRERLVARLPWEDDQGRPQYLDLSYFLPWFVVQDFAESLAPGGRGDDSLLPRDGMFTPPLLGIVEGLRHNQDTLGRPITQPSMSTTEKFGRVASFIAQTFLPPEVPGGSRSASIGRAMQAVARTSPEPIDWLDTLGGVMSAGTNYDRAVPARGFMPQSQAQVQTGGAAGAVAGGLAGLFAFSTAASDPSQSSYHARTRTRASASEIHREMGRIRSNKNLSPEEKNKRIRRLLDDLREIRREGAETISRMF